MRKLVTSLMGVLFLMASCNKQEAKLPAAEELVEETTLVSGRYCASQEVLEEQIATDPQRARNLEELERKTEKFVERNQSMVSRSAGTLYVPVVVNVVLPNASQVSDAQVTSQINVLNKDFSKSNAELSKSGIYLAGYSLSNVANCAVQFVVKQIIRKNSTVATFGSNDAVKKTSQGGLDPTNATTMLNVWVCDLSSGLLGYAQFPGGAAATDGVVIDYQAFGTSATYPMYAQFNLGRTATHEIGHWFNLRHIWGDKKCGDDLVGDTPSHDASNGGCPATGLKSTCTGKPLEQWMNYMDYTDDACMYMFSSGQKTRMDAAIDASRKTYVTTTP
ncbi:MAG: zinc metalloprotease [Segetibacter sp.]|nr:zinc metalloprotease [Segetibacter sp.]